LTNVPNTRLILCDTKVSDRCEGKDMQRGFVLAIGLPLLIGSICLAGDSTVTSEEDRANRDAEAAKPAFRVVRIIEVTSDSTEYTWPIWSPDGKKLVFAGPDSRGTYVRNADGTGPIKEVHGLDEWFNGVWSADSKALLVRRGRGGPYDLFDVETGEVTPVDSRDPFVGSLERKIHGATSYYPDDAPPPPDVQLKIDFRKRTMSVIEGDGDSSRITEFPHQVLVAHLSPRRDLVVFSQADGNDYVSRLDGSSLVNLGRGDMWDWSQDGRKLAYLSDYRQSHHDVTGWNVFAINADGSGKTRITDTPDLVERYPTWSPDGTRVAYSIYPRGGIRVAVLEEVD
jgi:Tol biopolymer transport system component